MKEIDLIVLKDRVVTDAQTAINILREVPSEELTYAQAWIAWDLLQKATCGALELSKRIQKQNANPPTATVD